ASHCRGERCEASVPRRTSRSPAPVHGDAAARGVTPRMMWLRVFVLALGFMLAPVDALAQSATKVARVGYMNLLSEPKLLEGVKQGLRDYGWRDGENVVVEVREAQNRAERIPELVAELVRLKVDVLVLTAIAIREAKSHAGNTPIVFVIADDPVRAGFVASLSHPGGRMTGLTSMNVDLDAKRL